MQRVIFSFMIFLPQCNAAPERYPQKAQQNGKTGEKCGNICMCDVAVPAALRKRQSPDNRHRAGNRQDVTGNKRAVNNRLLAVPYLIFYVGWQWKKNLRRSSLQNNQNKASRMPRKIFMKEKIQKID